MKKLITFSIVLTIVLPAYGLQISEIMSNPVGTDDGREWIEVYNDGSTDIDISSLKVSIKNGTPITLSFVQGQALLPPNGYAIIGSTVSSQTKFLQEYPNYTGILLKGNISLVNTGITSLDIIVNGSIVDSLSSYTAAKEGYTLSKISGSFVVSNPTPGSENQAAPQDQGGGSATSTDNQTTIAQLAPPSTDIILYMPQEKVVVAGADSVFTVSGMNRSGKMIDNLIYTWAFGDGGQGTGSSTKYRYAYTGTYIAQVEGNNTAIIGLGRMLVRVVPPDLKIAFVSSSKYGTYIDIQNPNTYALDLSQWKLSIDGSAYPFPKNTMIQGNTTTRFSGLAMGFASTTITASTSIKILFPHLEEVTHYIHPETQPFAASSTKSIQIIANKNETTLSKKMAVPNQKKVAAVTIADKDTSTTTIQMTLSQAASKDTRIASWIKGLFK